MKDTEGVKEAVELSSKLMLLAYNMPQIQFGLLSVNPNEINQEEKIVLCKFFYEM